jgi:FkbM family methyltransferase
MKFTSAAKRAAHLAHTVIGKSPLATRWYFALLSGVLRPLPECKFKRQILNSVLAARWPECDLPSRRVILGTKTSIALYPRFGEIGFESLVSRNPLYEREVFFFLEPRLADYDTVVEIGANVGLFSLFVATAFERLQKSDSQIFVFEPSRKAYLRLLQNLKLNAVRNVQAFNCAVGEKTVFASFFEPEDHLNNGSLLEEFALIFSSSLQVSQTLVLNAELLETLLSCAGRLLIKIDAEGAESRILTGLRSVIAKNKPDILLEVLPMYQDSLNSMGFLRAAGYRFFNITDRGAAKHEKFTASEFRDWLLVPNESSVETPQLVGRNESR